MVRWGQDYKETRPRTQEKRGRHWVLIYSSSPPPLHWHKQSNLLLSPEEIQSASQEWDKKESCWVSLPVRSQSYQYYFEKLLPFQSGHLREVAPTLFCFWQSDLSQRNDDWQTTCLILLFLGRCDQPGLDQVNIRNWVIICLFIITASAIMSAMNNLALWPVIYCRVNGKPRLVWV